MKELIEQMKVSLASVFALYLKTHNFHFNVEGPNFPQYHDFLGDMYEEIFDSFDPMAEELRTLQSYVPASFSRFLKPIPVNRRDGNEIIKGVFGG